MIGADGLLFVSDATAGVIVVVLVMEIVLCLSNPLMETPPTTAEAGALSIFETGEVARVMVDKVFEVDLSCEEEDLVEVFAFGMASIMVD